jgi:hypothetical protein
MPGISARLHPASGLLEDRDVELADRRSVRHDEVQQGTFALSVAGVMVLLFLVNDWRLYAGTGRFTVLLVLRLVTVAATGIAIAALRGEPTARRIDRATAGYLVVLAAMMAAMSALRPSDSTSPHFVNAFLVVMFFVGCPGPARNAAWGAVTLGLGAVVLVFIHGVPEDRLAQLAIPTILVSGGLVGWYGSRGVQRTRRELFVALLEQRQANARLTEARVEIRTLRGIIPICGHCKRIRDDGGYWFQLEEFISARSDALFSHGICPDCTREHFPEVG